MWSVYAVVIQIPDSKVRGVIMGPIWGRQDPGGPQVGPMNLAIWGYMNTIGSIDNGSGFTTIVFIKYSLLRPSCYISHIINQMMVFFLWAKA